MLPESAADRHRVVAGAFVALTRNVPEGAWDAPAPVEGWVVRDVVRHLTTWFPGFLASGSDIVLAHGPSVDDDPVSAWAVHSAAVQAVLDDPATAGRMFANPHTGELPLADAIDRFYTADVFMHSWDLGTATGQRVMLDADFCAQMVDGMEPMEEFIRSSGQYGPRVAVPADADPQTRLLGFIGRDPNWTSPALPR